MDQEQGFNSADADYRFLALVMSLVASGHALLYKRDSRAAALWVALTWFVPIVGALLYFVFGIN